MPKPKLVMLPGNIPPGTHLVCPGCKDRMWVVGPPSYATSTDELGAKDIPADEHADGCPFKPQN